MIFDFDMSLLATMTLPRAANTFFAEALTVRLVAQQLRQAPPHCGVATPGHTLHVAKDLAKSRSKTKEGGLQLTDCN